MTSPRGAAIEPARRSSEEPPERREEAREERRGLVLPRWLRALLMGMLFAFFFLGSPLLALVVIPLVRLFSGRAASRRTTYLLHKGMWLIARSARFFRIVELDLPPPPASLDREKPYVMISNHPTFIDMLVILGSFDGLTCVTNGRWWRHWAFGRLLRTTDYLPGPGAACRRARIMLGQMVAHLHAGHPLLIFPEGQRSLPDQLRRFRRGAVEGGGRRERAHRAALPGHRSPVPDQARAALEAAEQAASLHLRVVRRHPPRGPRPRRKAHPPRARPALRGALRRAARQAARLTTHPAARRMALSPGARAVGTARAVACAREQRAVRGVHGGSLRHADPSRLTTVNPGRDGRGRRAHGMLLGAGCRHHGTSSRRPRRSPDR
ncbi:MAG: 1-acyl-sn-glycerol-3-phosphate acyltransferase [Sandaracinaceae bacterium]|nr:1-acyl-sn-glycerol-3-phosphate acyltransferase [Sandaracinaceae bacterium]